MASKPPTPPKPTTKSAKDPQAASTSTPLTSQSKKRDPTSPLEESDAKKQLLSDSPGSKVPEVPSSVIDLVTDTDMSDPDAIDPGTEAVGESTKTTIKLTKSDLSQIADLIQDSFRTDLKDFLQDCVKSVVGNIMDGLKTRMDSIESENTSLRLENSALTKENLSLRESVDSLNSKCDDLEQYSRRNNVRVSGIKETVDENTDGIIVNLCSDLGLTIGLAHIDRSHRVGQPDDSNDPTHIPKPRAIIVKFTSYRYRQLFYKARFDMKSKGHKGVFINEDLTKPRNNLLYKARMLVKDKKVKKAWSSDGTVLVKDNSDEIHRIPSAAVLDNFL